jgi:hypothetical protein
MRARLERIIVVLGVLTTAVVAASAALAWNDAAATVKGGGKGVLTDPDGNQFRLKSFRVQGTVRDDGSASGRIRFRWTGSFAEVWGDPVCGGTCDTIILVGRVDSGSVAADGTVTLSGTAREVDKRRGRIVFDSGLDEPFSVVAGGSQGKNHFSLQWCLLPEFQIQGSIRVRAEHHHRGPWLMTSAARRVGCSE